MATLKTNAISPSTGTIVSVGGITVTTAGAVSGVTTLSASGTITAPTFAGNATTASTASTATSATTATTVTGATQSSITSIPNLVGIGTLSSLTVTGTLASGLITTTGTAIFTGAFGYQTGGNIVQTGSKSNPVTLNKLTGTIVLAGQATAINTAITFTLTNSTIAAEDMLIVVNQSSTGTSAITANYNFATKCTAGSAAITMRNEAAILATETTTLKFIVIKAPIS